MKISKKTILFLAIFGLLFSGAVFAGTILNSYTASSGSTVTVTSKAGIDYDITNTNGSVDYFVPNKTQAEWDAFKVAADSYLTDLTVTKK